MTGPGAAPLRMAVTGRNGQVVTSLLERAGPTVAVTALGRPELDLGDAESIRRALGQGRYDVIVNAAAYTAVDKAEQEEALATAINGAGAGAVAACAKAEGIPILHLSTDYVFDGMKDGPYREIDETGPAGAYGRSKLAGERQVAGATDNHAILRTAWVYSPFGANFVRTMLRLGAERPEISVVADQRGNPTYAPDIADAVIAIARRLARDPDPALRGTFHLVGADEASWADLAEAVFAAATRHGRAPVAVRRITTAEYPTPARRPANSRLDTSKLQDRFGIALPSWRMSVERCVERLLTTA